MKIILLILVFNFLFSDDVYKEIKINNEDINNISYLTSLGIDVDHIHKTDDYIQFAINEYDLSKLILHDIDYEIIHENLEDFYLSRLDNNHFERDLELGSMGGYYTFQEIENNLDELSSMYPDIISEKTSIGLSLEGRNIWAIKISDNYEIDESEPEVLYTGLHHAREPMSYMNLFYFMHWLGENYDSDLLAQHLVNNRELWFIPAINPDGLVYNESIAPNGGGMQRKNMRQTCSGGFYGADGIDPNRNYSYMWGYDNEGSSNDGCNETYRGTGPFSEPETQAVRDFVNLHEFKINFNYHSYSDLLIYPFGYEYENQAPQEDIDIFIEYGLDMVQYNNYALGTGPDLLYPVNGEACDWMYGEKNIFSYTPEIGGNSDGFWPPTSRIVPLAEENLYPNQVLALNGGSKYDLEINIEDTNFDFGVSYPLYISIFNRGLSDSNGEVMIDIEHSDNLIFELNQFSLDELESREFIDLGGISYFQLNPNLPSGSIEEIEVKVYDQDNYKYTETIQIITGQTVILNSDDFETTSSWVVGGSEDDATKGIWERVEPNPTYEYGEIVQPDSDHTEEGTYCFITENSSNQNNPGETDVDGGRTTLYSPIYDLSMHDKALVSYWKWYTNNLGNNPGTDYWMVDVSNDAGNNWISLENTRTSNNYWVLQQFLISDYLTLTNNMQFRFIAEDVFNDGDVGSGGSLIEAGIDDFLIEVFEENQNNLIGDINNDGLINVVDVVQLVNIILSNQEDNNADLNDDGVVNVLDIIALVNLILE